MTLDNAAKNNVPPKKKVDLEEVEQFLAVGLAVLFDSDIKKPKSRRYHARILGWEAGKFIMLSFNTSDRKRSMVLGDKRCAMRFLHSGRPCVITVLCLDRRVEAGAPFFRVSWPEDIRYANIRSEDRYELEIPCDLRLPGGKSVTAEIRNLSLNGGRLYLPSRVKEDDCVMCTFSLPNGFMMENVRFKARHIFKSGKGWEAGCQLQDLDEDAKQNLEFYLSVLKEQHTPGNDEKKKILVIERNRECRDSLSSFLQENGFEIIIHSDIVQAFTWIGISHLHGILINPNQLQVNAHDLCTMIRKTPTGGDIPVFLYSDTDNLTKEEATAAGATDVISSISDQDKVLSLLKSL